jgi:two-component system, chemotaxis family, protein-glutamate methylesterase/glutaminase
MRTNRKIRVLIVDDSVVVRSILSSMLSTDAAIEVAGVAANGKIALARIPQLKPDVVILDVEMPELDGLGTLAEIRKTQRKLPVIMFSTLTERGAATTLDALGLGANDYVAKPSTGGGVAGQIASVLRDLSCKIKAHCGFYHEIAPASAASIAKPDQGFARTFGEREPDSLAEVVAIGISTGGPNALAELIPTIYPTIAVPILIVQHMPRVFTKILAERLSAKSKIPVTEAQPGDVLTPGHAWIAPGDFHMTVRRYGIQMVIDTNQNPHENSCRPSADVLFRSVAGMYGPTALAIVMTGMGQDGLRGCELIRRGGGRVLVQDEASSVVWGMPGFVARAGLAHRIVPLSELGNAIMMRVRKRTSQLNSNLTSAGTVL